MSLLDHLTDLRNRILYALGGVVVGLFATWGFRERIMTFVVEPIQRHLPPGTKLKVLGVPDALFVYMKVSALAALFLVAPWVIYQVWRFVAPGLYRKEQRWSLVVVILGSLLFFAGGAFAYYVAFPFAVEFLVDFGSEQFEAAITAERYLSFLMTIILGLGLMFELPIFIFALAQVGVVTPRFLMRHFRWAVLIIFIIAAVITPTPDPFNMCLFALPAVGLYLLGVAAAALVGRKKRGSEVSEGT